MLSSYGENPAKSLGVMQPRNARVTLEKLAINAVMAGCLPEYMPVLIAAVQAITEPSFNIHGLQTTTNPVSPLLIVNGPVRDLIGLNSGRGTLGPGYRANATIGRAIRLLLLNVGGAKPWATDMSVHGSPAKYISCMGENEAGIKILVSCLTLPGTPAGQWGDAAASLRTRSRSSKSLYGQMCIHRFKPPSSVDMPAARGENSSR